MALAWRVSIVPLLAAAALIALTVSLGNWQVRRAHYKEALAERLRTQQAQPPVDLGAQAVDAAAVELRRVRATGTWLPQLAVLQDNRVRRGAPGYHVFMPMALAGNMHVLVNRGWIAAGAQRGLLPHIATPPGTVTVEGIARVPGERVFELAAQDLASPVWQNVTLERFRSRSQLPLQPVVIQQTSDAPDGLVRDWPAPDLGVDTHRGYALTWYSLAGLTAVLLAAFGIRWPRRRGRD